MHIWIRTPVTARDGVTVGRVTALVVHPASWRILQVLVRRGRWWNRSDIAMDVADIERGTPQRTWLRLDSWDFAQRPVARVAALRRPSRDWLTPFQWRRGEVYWPANYDGPIYVQVTPAQLKRWSTIRGPATASSSAPGNPTVVAQDGQKVGRATEVVVNPESRELQSVRFMADGGPWPERQAEVGSSWVARRDRWYVWLVFDFETIRSLVRSRPLLPTNVVAAGGRLQRELERQLSGDSLYDVDPYNVLAQPSETGFETPIERDEASVINPQPRP